MNDQNFKYLSPSKFDLHYKLLKFLKIHEIFCKNPRIIFVLFHDVHEENMFTTNLEDGREEPSMASNLKTAYIRTLKLLHFFNFIVVNKFC